MASQWAGVVSKAQLSVSRLNENVLIAKVSHPEIAQINAELPSGWDSHMEEEQLEFQPMTLSSRPFEIRLKGGAIHSLAVEKSLTNEEVNQLKGIASQLQVDLRAKNLIKCKYNQFPEEGKINAVYKTMEPTVTGACEMLYDISPLADFNIQSRPEWVPMPELKENGQFFIEVVKTKNYSNCDQRMGYHFGITGMSEWKPNSNQMGEFFSVSSKFPFCNNAPILIFISIFSEIRCQSYCHFR